jgi:flagellin
VSFKLTNAGGQAGSLLQASAGNENIYTTAGAAAFTALTNAVRDDGEDLGASINGIAATSRGATTRISTDYLDLSLTLSAAGAQALGSFTAFTITGGGAKFNLGPNVDILNQVSLGIKNVAARNLGSTGVGYLDALGSGKSNNVVDGDLAGAQKIVNAAIDQVSSLRGRLGAFQKNVVGATIRQLGVSLENTSAAESSIRDTDFASETAMMTRSQILVNAATNVLSMANNSPQSVLRLLQQ